MKPLISVVMPSFNAEKYIKEAILSVLDQTYSNLELIVINDNSSDATQQIVAELAKKDTRIILYTTPNQSGVSNARNTGVLLAHGDWIAFLDSDDAWDKQKLEKQMHSAEQTGGELLFTGSAFMDEKSVRKREILQIPSMISYRKLLNQNLISCSSVLVKRDLVLRYKMEGDDMHEDFAVWLQILREGRFAYGINEPLLIYRLSSESKSGDKKKAALMTWRVYRYMGLKLPSCIYHMIQYTVRSLIKYGRIKSR